MILLLFFYFKLIFSSTGIKVGYTSSILKNNTLYVYEPSDAKFNGSSITIYDLKDGQINDTKRATIHIKNVPFTYTPQFLQLPQGLKNGRSDQIWMIGGKKEGSITSNDLDSSKWTGQFSNDEELKFDSSFIQQPNFDNFPKGGYSQTIVNINNNPTLYIIGGFIYSSQLKNQTLTNYVFKYEFNTNTWSDLSEASKSVLPPIAAHQTIYVNNFLLVANGLSTNTTSGSFSQTVPANNLTTYNTIDKLYKFDLDSQEWSVINTKVNLDETNYRKGEIYGASLNIYNEKIIAYGCLYNFNFKDFEPQIATLDYNTWEWKWYPTKNEAGVDNNLKLQFHQALVINDQLLLIHGLSNQRNDTELFVVNLKNYKFQPTLNYSGNYKPTPSNNSEEDGSYSGLPTYIIIIIVIACILAVALQIAAIWVYLRYKKKASGRYKSDQKMQEVWAGSTKIDNSSYIPKNGNLEKVGGSGGSTELINAISSNRQTNECINTQEIMDLPYFQHEVDLDGMSETKTSQI